MQSNASPNVRAYPIIICGSSIPSISPAPEVCSRRCWRRCTPPQRSNAGMTRRGRQSRTAHARTENSNLTRQSCLKPNMQIERMVAFVMLTPASFAYRIRWGRSSKVYNPNCLRPHERNGNDLGWTEMLHDADSVSEVHSVRVRPDAMMAVERIDDPHLPLGEREVEDIRILLHPPWMH